ncbi:MAG: hypothetical protein RI554_04945, partial [Trueperaceae bacterium]|nr:hypothetical protein [Trueperaceae bacterium]
MLTAFLLSGCTADSERPATLRLDGLSSTQGAPGTLLEATGRFTADTDLLVCDLAVLDPAYAREDDAAARWAPRPEADADAIYPRMRGAVPDLPPGRACGVTLRRDGTVVSPSDGASPTFTADPDLPGRPEAITVSDGDGRVRLAFDPPAANGAPIEGYELSLDDGPFDAAAGPAGVVGPPLVVSGLDNGVRYEARVRARSAAGVGAAATATLRPFGPPDAPTNLAGAPGDGRVRLTFDAPTSNGRPIERYDLRVAHAADAGTWTAVSASDATPEGAVVVTATDLDDGTEVTLSVRAANAAGPGPAASVDVTPRPALRLELPAGPPFTLMLAGSLWSHYVRLAGPGAREGLTATASCGDVSTPSITDVHPSASDVFGPAPSGPWSDTFVYVRPDAVSSTETCDVTVRAVADPDVTTTVTADVLPRSDLTSVTDLWAGGTSGLAVRDGALVGWVGGAPGTVGVLETPFTNVVPLELDVPWSTPASVTDVAVGTFHGVVVLSDGQVWSWGGSKVTPVLGAGATQVAPKGVRIDGNLPADTRLVRVDVATNGNTTLALDDEGHAWAWGKYAGTLVSGSDAGTSLDVPTRVPAPGGVTFTDVAVG